MNEMTRVATNGSWVTMIRKISPGSSGARRIHRSRLVSAWPAVGGEECRSCLLAGGAETAETSVVIGSLPSSFRVRLADGGCELLPALQGTVDGLLAGDRRADVL